MTATKTYKEAVAANGTSIRPDIRHAKKAVSFRPIVDIQKFITENVCDLPARPDIDAMQQNIRDYKHQELLAQRQEQKLAALQEIQELYLKSERALNQARIHQYLFARAGKKLEESAVLRLENERRDKTELLGELTSRYDALDAELGALNKRLEQLISDRANSDVYRERERLEEQRRRLESEQGKFLEELRASRWN
jgi:hypothetical protein